MGNGLIKSLVIRTGVKPEGNKYLPGLDTQVTHGTVCQSLTRSGRYPDHSSRISDLQVSAIRTGKDI
jgi:hypothetical protein